VSARFGPGVLSPRLYRQENLPAGPAWSDVKRLIAAPAALRLVNSVTEPCFCCWRSMGCAVARSEVCLWRTWIGRDGSCGASQQDRPRPGIPADHRDGQASGVIWQRPARLRSRELFLTLHAPFRQLSAGRCIE